MFAMRMLCKTDRLPKVFLRWKSQNTFILSDPPILRYLGSIMLEHESLMTKKKRDAVDAQRLLEIKPIVCSLQERLALYESIENLKELNTKECDEEVKQLIKEEARIYLKRISEVDTELQSVLLEPSLTVGGVLLEVVAGAGGQESMLFARELFDMYLAHALYKKWDHDMASIENSDLGGFRKACMLISGLGVPQLMSMEAGVHRVQRIPATEKGGRIHTSTVSVAVLPKPTNLELNIPDRDLTIETKRASGAGGQHVNTTNSAVRIIHNPTETVVECQEGRSQIKNKEIAMQKLRTLLLEKHIKEQTSKVNNRRKSQIGNSDRNEKIRTYNYPQDRVTDHRIAEGNQHSLRTFMKGGEILDTLQEELVRHNRYQVLMEEIHKSEKQKELQTEQ